MSEPTITVFEASTGEVVRAFKIAWFKEYAGTPNFDDGGECLHVYALSSSGAGSELNEFNLTTGLWRMICNERLTFIEQPAVGVDGRRKGDEVPRVKFSFGGFPLASVHSRAR